MSEQSPAPTVPVQSFVDESAAEALSRGYTMVSLGAVTQEIANWWFGVADIRTEFGLVLIAHVTDAPGFAPERCANIRKFFPANRERNADSR